MQDYQSQPLLSRLKRRLNTSGMFCDRTGLSFGKSGYLQACFYLSVAAVLKPKYAIALIWHQVLSPKN
ncbi:MAG: hypothetical protein KME05_20830 [Gloeocapsa sp. UFS-A4-WI-NPMV-4B04]|nr:hypothetical protein [Gloeocapsa sp. UFS-A4-WI-NPMV-4B04]